MDEQCLWYSNKSKSNRKRGTAWFSVFIGLQALAVVFTIVRVGYPERSFWQTEVLVAGAAVIVGWIQAKRFRELAAAYGLTAHEIGLAKLESSATDGENRLSAFVIQTETAFSREHTQWIARKDDG